MGHKRSIIYILDDETEKLLAQIYSNRFRIEEIEKYCPHYKPGTIRIMELFWPSYHELKFYVRGEKKDRRTIRKEWRNWNYHSAILVDFCREKDCNWQKETKSSPTHKDITVCPKCGGGTNTAMLFGGLTIIYDRLFDRFSLLDRQRNKIVIDCADCPETILFMLERYGFGGRE